MPFPLDTIKTSLDSYKVSQGYRDEIMKYSQNLYLKNLPIIFSLPDLSFKIGLPFDITHNIIKSKNQHYSTFKIRKKTVGHRWVTSPDELLKRIQRWIYENILMQIKEHPSSYGFVPQRSIVDNAKKHVGQDAVLNIDLYRFFDSIEQKRVTGLFKTLGYHSNLAYFMAQLLTVELKASYWKEVSQDRIFSKKFIDSKPEVLPQGSPASPRIANYMAYGLDIKMEKLSKKLGVNYSRYADDLTFSGDYKNLPSIKSLRQIIYDEGFYLNENKIKLLKRSQQQIVTGLVVNEKISVPRKYKDVLRTELYHCIHKGPKNHLIWLEENKRLEIKANYRDYLLGKVCFIHSVEPKVGKKYFDLYNLITWEI